MKKLFLALASLLLLAVIVACTDATTTLTTTKAQTTTTSETTTVTTELTTTETTTVETTTLSQLSVPENIDITSNIITFDGVDNAVKYKITVYDDSDTLVGEYNITSGFDLSLLLQPGGYKYQLRATGSGYLDSNKSVLTAFSIVDESRISVIEGEEMNNLEYVRWLGRTYYNQEEAAKYFFFTASGFEVAFFGTGIDITLKANKSSISGKQAYVVLFIDGEENPNNGTTYRMDQAEKTITVRGLTDGYHTIKLVKRTEASDSNTALVSIETDGYFTYAPIGKSFRIQYIAASSSTGFGNLGSLTVNKTTDNSDGLRAYAYLTSYLLDADTSIFSASGWGVSRGYNTGGEINEIQNIPYAFTRLAIDDTNTVFDEDWDFSEYIPDVIVVNLGTNDFNASSYSSLSELEKQALEERFVTDYTNFLMLLNNMYPNAKIIVAYGLMNEALTLGDVTLEIIENANTEIGHTRVYPFLMEAAGSNGNAFGCSYHPNVQTGMNVAEDLAAYISLLTGREVIREMIENE